MTIEQVELRKILSQMLADNGVNRETIIPFVKDVLQEKKVRQCFTTINVSVEVPNGESKNESNWNYSPY